MKQFINKNATILVIGLSAIVGYFLYKKYYNKKDDPITTNTKDTTSPKVTNFDGNLKKSPII